MYGHAQRALDCCVAAETGTTCLVAEPSYCILRSCTTLALAFEHDSAGSVDLCAVGLPALSLLERLSGGRLFASALAQAASASLLSFAGLPPACAWTSMLLSAGQMKTRPLATISDG